MCSDLVKVLYEVSCWTPDWIELVNIRRESEDIYVLLSCTALIVCFFGFVWILTCIVNFYYAA